MVKMLLFMTFVSVMHPLIWFQAPFDLWSVANNQQGISPYYKLLFADQLTVYATHYTRYFFTFVKINK